MIPYYCNEAMLELHGVRSLVDRTRQLLEIVTEGGAEIELSIERLPLSPPATLAASVDARVAERRRSLRGFELLSTTEREYPSAIGLEVRSTFVDKERGPRFLHEFHCALDGTWMLWQGSCRLSHAAACDAWMQTTLQSLTLR